MSEMRGISIWPTLALFITLVSFISSCSSIYSPTDSRDFNQADVAPLAQCLSAKGAVLYGASWCPHTVRQAQAFGEAFAYINYVECTEYGSLCRQAGIDAYPTWIIGGEKETGFCDLITLADMAGCDY